ACNCSSGEYLRIEPTASNVCGDPLAGASLQGVTSQRINIFGVPTNEPALRLTSSIDNVVLGPVNSTTAAVTADYTFRLTNTAPGSVELAADDYRFKIALPEGWTM